MANKIDRYEAKSPEEFATWLGHLPIDRIHKIYVKGTGHGKTTKWSCMAILHDIEKAGDTLTKKVLESDGRD